MFMEDDSIAKNDAATKIKKNRWGTKQIHYTDLVINPKKITQDTDTISIEASYEANDNVDGPVFGFLLKNTAGTIMFGTNTRLLNHDVAKVSKGDKAKITWQIPNILNDGDYTVDIAVANSNETAQYDWWEDAKLFTVRREQHTSYATEPPIRVNITNG